MPKKPAETNASLAHAIEVAKQKAELRQSLYVAIQGCCHGELNTIYQACSRHEQSSGRKIDLLLCCGDFQSVRDPSDLSSMAVPVKYRVMGDFPAYVTGEKKAPILTIFIGGNHEASNVLWEQYYGGYVAPNIYYLGHSGVVHVGGLRIAGLSGIFKRFDFLRPYPIPPYTPVSVRDAYHVRKFEVDKLTALQGSYIDLFMSHDWPVGITKFGDEAQLLRYKPFFEEDIRHNALGNPHTMPLLRLLKPRVWAAAHLHCHFVATVPHEGASPCTEFVALDKCSKGKGFLDVYSLPVRPEQAPLSTEPITIELDPQWLSIIVASHKYLPLTQAPYPEEMVAKTLLSVKPHTSKIVASTTVELLKLLALEPFPLSLAPEEVCSTEGCLPDPVPDDDEEP